MNKSISNVSDELFSNQDMKVERIHRLDAEEFRKNYLDKKPVVISGVLDEWRAMECWNPEYLAKKLPRFNIVGKRYSETGKMVLQNMTMLDYVKELDEYEESAQLGKSDSPYPSYCHDIPIFKNEFLTGDVDPFPTQYLPSWYRKEWWKYVQFFMGPERSLTPLHFDCLLTHNIFFQVLGKKVFTVFPYDNREHCGQHSWRWFELDPENPDLDRFPGYEKCSPQQVEVNQGDILYMPPGTLHHVRGQTGGISINIDFHTRRSAAKGVVAGLKGMPVKNVYFNFLCFLGLVGRIPEKMIFPFYRGYLNYVS